MTASKAKIRIVLKNNRFPVLIWLVTLIPFLFTTACQNNPPEQKLPAEQKRQFANVLYNQQLYRQAIDEYRDYLMHYPLSAREQANVSYQIANIYFEKLHDYENALAYYLRIKYLYPESGLEKQVSKKIVECLERLKRSAEAQQVMEQEAALDEAQKPRSHPGEVIARIGSREITTGDLQYEINQLPEYLRGQFNSPAQKKEFLKQFIIQELLYDSAKRQGLDKDPDVRAGVLRAEKALMAQKLLEQEIQKEVKLDSYTNKDVETYFQAHKEKYAERDEKGNVKRIPSFAEVAEQVAQDFIQEKQQEAYQRLVERLMKAEQVVIYEDRID